MIRLATPGDVEAMADLAEAKRQAYANGAYGFHRPAPDARALHAPFLARLVDDREYLVLMHEHADERVDAFLVGRIGPAPPPFRETVAFHVDDFAVAEPRVWPTAGAALLAAAARQAGERGARRAIVVAGGRGVEPAKRELLLRLGLALEAEWWVRRVVPEPGDGPDEHHGFEAVVGPAPPVYDPGGPTCLALRVDCDDELAALERFAARSSAVLVIVPVAVERADVRSALEARRYAVASEWYAGDVEELVRG